MAAHCRTLRDQNFLFQSVGFGVTHAWVYIERESLLSRCARSLIRHNLLIYVPSLFYILALIPIPNASLVFSRFQVAYALCIVGPSEFFKDVTTHFTLIISKAKAVSCDECLQKQSISIFLSSYWDLCRGVVQDNNLRRPSGCKVSRMAGLFPYSKHRHHNTLERESPCLAFFYVFQEGWANLLENVPFSDCSDYGSIAVPEIFST